MFISNADQVRAFFEQSMAVKSVLNLRTTPSGDHFQFYLTLSVGGVLVVSLFSALAVVAYCCIRKDITVFKRIYGGEVTELDEAHQVGGINELIEDVHQNIRRISNDHPVDAILTGKTRN